MNIISKTSTFVLAIISLLLVIPGGCVFRNMEGNGLLVKQERQLGDFNQIHLSGPMNVYLTQDKTASVMVHADENLTDLIRTTIDNNNILVVDWDAPEDTKVKLKNQVDVYINYKNIHTLKNALVGNLECLSSINVDSLHIQSTSVGKMNLIISCHTLTTNLSGVGNATLSGNADEVIIQNSAVGNLKAFELLVNRLIIKHKGVGNVEVNAEKEINIYASGVGNLYYSGNAEVGEFKVNGTGKVEKR